jgi:hypothetical protein
MDTANLPSCKCSRCWGFAEWCLENLGHDYGLPHASGHNGPTRLNVLTFGPKPGNVVALPAGAAGACDGGYTCPCEKCCTERADLVRKAAARRAA